MTPYENKNRQPEKKGL